MVSLSSLHLFSRHSFPSLGRAPLWPQEGASLTSGEEKTGRWGLKRGKRWGTYRGDNEEDLVQGSQWWSAVDARSGVLVKYAYNIKRWGYNIKRWGTNAHLCATEKQHCVAELAICNPSHDFSKLVEGWERHSEKLYRAYWIPFTYCTIKNFKWDHAWKSLHEQVYF